MLAANHLVRGVPSLACFSPQHLEVNGVVSHKQRIRSLDWGERRHRLLPAVRVAKMLVVTMLEVLPIHSSSFGGNP